MWSSLDLTVGKTPVFYDGEIQIIAIRDVGLYNGDEKSLDHSGGWVYLTNFRICYVDDSHPEENSCFVNLSQIIGAQYLPRFLLQSPKISIHLKPPPEDIKDTKSTKSWVCEICTFPNTLSVRYVPDKSELPTCENCGVQCCEEPTLITDTSALPSISEGNEIKSEENKCPRCTFVNHKYMRECEICGYVLKQHKKKIKLGDTVKISFRSGGSKEFTDALRKSYIAISSSMSSHTFENLSSSQSTPMNLNHGITRLRLDQAQNGESEIDFSDFGRMSSNAKRIMNLLEAHKRVSPDYVPTYALEGTLVFREFARDEKSYHQQLARQISEFLESNGILRKEGGLMTLFDVYAAYNRARGVDPITAGDLIKALQVAPELGMPIRVRTLKSGTKVVESNLWTSSEDRLAAWIRRTDRNKGVSILDVGAQFGWSIAVTTEQLEQSEHLGLICRDESSAGALYYLNRFHERA